jgi:uncharacterized OB-fold protein
VSQTTPPRPLPVLEKGTDFFWKAGAHDQLMIAQCDTCGRYHHPPLPYCPTCPKGSVVPTAVSGFGRVASFTVNYQAWVPGLSVPYIFSAVELVEQAELYVLTNIIGCGVEQVRIGLEVVVAFEPIGEIFMPMFKPRG